MTGHIENLVEVKELDEPLSLTVTSGEAMLVTTMGKAPLHSSGCEGLARNLGSIISQWHGSVVLGVQKLLANLKLNWKGAMQQACPTCVSGKLTQKPFALNKPRELKKEQILLAIDYAGPMQVTARNGHTGLLNIVVEPFHLDMVYPLRNKSSRSQLDALEACVAKLKAYSPEHRVVLLKSDNDAEYVGNEGFSTPYSPQQNGKVGRRNRIIVEIARAIMLGAHLPMRYWVDAVVAAVFVRNRCPTEVFDGKTPMEALLGKALDISNLRVFGCKVQVL
ncbi:Rve-domain-containing hypothetical protein, partial [Phytophthora megakarya]